MLTQDCNWKPKRMIFEMSWSILTALRDIPTHMYIKAKQISGKELGPLDRKGREHSIPLAAKKNIEDKGGHRQTFQDT